MIYQLVYDEWSVVETMCLKSGHICFYTSITEPCETGNMGVISTPSISPLTCTWAHVVHEMIHVLPDPTNSEQFNQLT